MKRESQVVGRRSRIPSEPRNHPAWFGLTSAERSTAPFRPKTMSPASSKYSGSRSTTSRGALGVFSCRRREPYPTSPTDIKGTPTFEYSLAFKAVPKGPVFTLPPSAASRPPIVVARHSSVHTHIPPPRAPHRGPPPPTPHGRARSRGESFPAGAPSHVLPPGKE